MRGHPWVYANEVRELLAPEWDGRAVECRDAQGRILGSGIYNGRSQIVWRGFSTGKEDFGREYLSQALERACRRREGRKVGRLVWSESDGIPGLIVDRYGPVLVAQFLTLAVDRQGEMVLDWLQEALQPVCILLRNDAPSREKEGLAREVRVGRGVLPEAFWLELGGLEFYYEADSGQKTGLYLDQCEQHGRVARFAEGRDVLDVFCNQGGFALHCAKAGARTVTGIDSSAEAIGRAQKNAERNGLSIHWICENAFDFMKRQKPESRDLIILDPPPFAKARDRVQEAMKGYKELNLRAILQLRPGGVLATYSCSHAIGYERYREMLADAAADAGRRLRLLEICHQSADHPVWLNMPESEYLRGYVLEVL
ncbi:MAG: class I SAM-dependent rRNA methyltransferase [Blastochloris sp.]|nr:class I SAM-dependent rRNA methyltransferase [Blastochloris sp.]